jgi:hypothetical protein
MPLDPEPVAFEQAGLVAYNPRTGGGRMLVNAELPHLGEWKASGVTVHRSHFATCPNAASHRGAGSGQLDLLGEAAA